MEKKFFTLKELSEITNSKLVGDPKKLIFHISDLEHATEDDASFLSNPKYQRAMENSQAGVIFVDPTILTTPNKNFLIHEKPSLAFQKLIELFSENSSISGFKGIHPSAIIHETARIGKNVQIGPLSVIDERVEIGDETIIGASCVIAAGTKMGSNTHIYPHVTIRENCLIGNGVVIQPGAVIGSCGFGFIQDKQGRHQKLEQVGNVVIEDDVEVGANTTIDRSRFKSTIIGEGTKIDNLVQIAHGVVIGKHSLVISQTGIAGSTKIGNHVIIAGQVAVNGHIEICDGAILSARTGVTKSIDKPGKYGGYPAMPLNEYHRNHIQVLKLNDYVKELKELKERIKILEER